MRVVLLSIVSNQRFNPAGAGPVLPKKHEFNTFANQLLMICVS